MELIRYTYAFIGAGIASIASMIIGMIWYSSLLFGNKSTNKETQKSESCPNNTLAHGLIGTLLCTFITASIMSCFIHRLHIIDTTHGVIFGAMVWLGFVGALSITHVFFGKITFKSWLIDNGYECISLCVIGAIVAHF
jgi:CBS domain containing-hemolysin-like protein